MDPQELSKIQSLSDLDSLAHFLVRYFPGFNPSERSIQAYENELYKVYFNILEKIFLASPEIIQDFMRILMFKYEIMNIKTIIIGVIAQIPPESRNQYIFNKPSEILERVNLLKNLMRAKSLDEIIKYCQQTPYEKIIKEEIETFKSSNEIFNLEHALDKYFYNMLIITPKLYPEPEKQFIEEYIKTNLDFYNLNLIFRALYNRIPLSIIEHYLIPNGYLFKQNEINKLIECTTIDDLLIKLRDMLKPHKKYLFIIDELAKLSPNALDNISNYFLQQYIARFQRNIIEDIPLMTLFQIFRIIFFKENEIKEAVAQAVQLSLDIKN